MLSLLAGFLTSVLMINILPVPDVFSPEAKIHDLVRWENEFWAEAEERVTRFSAEKFPQLHLRREVRAGPATSSAPVTSLPVKKLGVSEFSLDHGKAAVWDEHSRTFLFQQEGEKKVPMASITKLMTALVFLENNPGWDHVHEVTREDRREGGRIFVYLGDKVEMEDLFNISLVASANTATMALVHSTGMTEEEFVEEMNRKAESIGLVKTEFTDVSGLDEGNVSTAKELARLAEVALEDADIREAVLKKEYEFTTRQGDTRTVLSTDSLLKTFPYKGIEILGGKTGYTPEAGYCFVGKFRDKENGRELISVVLGTEDEKARFKKTGELIDWAYRNHHW